MLAELVARPYCLFKCNKICLNYKYLGNFAIFTVNEFAEVVYKQFFKIGTRF